MRLWLLLIGGVLSAQTADTRRWFAEATAALTRGDLTQARLGLERVLRADPKHLPALGNLGVVYAQLEEYGNAIQTYERALRLAPANARLWLNLGLAHFKQEDFVAAATALQRAVELDAASGQARELLAACQVFRKQYALAIPELEKLRAGGGASVSYFLALAYRGIGDTTRAAAALDEMFTRAASPAQARLLTGRAHYELQEFEPAVQDFEQALRLDASLEGVHRELGKALVSLRRNDEAAAHFRTALDRNPRDTEARYFLGAVLQQLGRHSEAAAMLEPVRGQRPNFFGGHYYAGRALSALGRHAEAIAALETAARLRPEEASTYYHLSRAQKAEGQDAAAQATLAKMRALQSQKLAEDAELIRGR